MKRKTTSNRTGLVIVVDDATDQFNTLILVGVDLLLLFKLGWIFDVVAVVVDDDDLAEEMFLI